MGSGAEEEEEKETPATRGESHGGRALKQQQRKSRSDGVLCTSYNTLFSVFFLNKMYLILILKTGFMTATNQCIMTQMSMSNVNVQCLFALNLALDRSSLNIGLYSLGVVSILCIDVDFLACINVLE